MSFSIFLISISIKYLFVVCFSLCFSFVHSPCSVHTHNTSYTKQKQQNKKKEKFHHHVIRRSKIHKKIKIKNSAPSFSFDLLFHPFLKIGWKFLSLGKNSNFAGLYFSIKKNKTENTDDQQFQDHWSYYYISTRSLYIE
jgi:hypothetical protein